MPNRSLSFASLFSGCGGFDLGYLSRGFRAKGAFDIDQDAVANYGANLGGPIALADLTTGIPNEHRIKQIDALIAGPPCQGFSTAGKREVNDHRNHLLTLTGKIALRLTPKVLVVENVAGALSGEHAKYLRSLEMAMRAAGYRTHTLKCQVAELGTAQLRKRVLFFAWNTGLGIQFRQPREEPRTLRMVLEGVETQHNHNPRRLVPHTRDWYIAKRIKAGQKLSNVRGGDNSISTWQIPEVFGAITEDECTVLELLRRLRRQDRTRDFGDADPVSYERLQNALGRKFKRIVEGLIAKGYVRRIGGCVDLVGTFNGKYRRLAWEKPSCTVDTRFGEPRYFLHPSQLRGFTVREAARIQAFPDSYVFQGNEQTQYRLIGNAVPPPLASYAAEITLQLLGRA
ncbi:MAG: DNA cytosine methyltransferase [Planctomycetota bacterium]|jgi:DNA (cytosine-5)-methyltransferase 1